MPCLFFVLTSLLVVGSAWAQSAPAPAPAPAPDLYSHYLKLQELQQSYLQRSIEDQTRLQPRLDQAGRQACTQLRREMENGASLGDYRQQGGDHFAMFVLQLERYCQDVR